MNLFVKEKIIPEYLFEDISCSLQNVQSYPSGVKSAKKPNGKINIKKDLRNSISKSLDTFEFLDLNKILENYCNIFDSEYNPADFIVKELEYLKYGISGHFKPHTDTIQNENPKRIRIFTTITLLSKTQDLEGGDLILFDKNLNEVNTNIDVGETIIFSSSTLHQVTPITKGGREVLVGWIYYR
jgi:hypothetical protein